MIPEYIARDIVRAALAEDRCSEFLETMMHGGMATVDHQGRLVLTSKDQLRQMMIGS